MGESNSFQQLYPTLHLVLPIKPSPLILRGHWGQIATYHCFVFGTSSVVITGTLPHKSLLGRVKEGNAMIVAVLPWLEAKNNSVRVTVFLSALCGINCSNVIPFFFRVSLFANIICKNVVPNGRGK